MHVPDDARAGGADRLMTVLGRHRHSGCPRRGGKFVAKDDATSAGRRPRSSDAAVVVICVGARRSADVRATNPLECLSSVAIAATVSPGDWRNAVGRSAETSYDARLFSTA